jgi:hypothetical protein
MINATTVTPPLNYCERMRARFNTVTEDLVTGQCGEPATIKDHGKWYCEASWEKTWGKFAKAMRDINSDRTTL